MRVEAQAAILPGMDPRELDAVEALLLSQDARRRSALARWQEARERLRAAARAEQEARAELESYRREYSGTWRAFLARCRGGWAWVGLASPRR